MQITWRPEIVETLRKLLADGLSSQQVANQLNLLYNIGISRSAVIGKASRSGLKLHGLGRVRASPRKRTSRISNPLGAKKPRFKKMAHPIWSKPIDPVDREVETYSLRLNYEQITNSSQITQCRYIHTLDSGHEVYCGNPTALGTAWCEKCYRKVYRGPDGSSMQTLVQVVKVA